MKRLVLSAVLAVFCMLSAQAQTVRYAFFSSERVWNALPQAQQARQKVEELRRQYADEAERTAQEFNEKYEDFLEGQRSFAPAIYKKRQMELQEMMDRNVAFRKECEQQLAQQQDSLMQNVAARIDAAVKAIGNERQYAFVLNADGDALPYTDPALCDDITEQIIEKLKK